MFAFFFISSADQYEVNISDKKSSKILLCSQYSSFCFLISGRMKDGSDGLLWVQLSHHRISLAVALHLNHSSCNLKTRLNLFVVFNSGGKKKSLYLACITRGFSFTLYDTVSEKQAHSDSLEIWKNIFSKIPISILLVENEVMTDLHNFLYI